MRTTLAIAALSLGLGPLSQASLFGPWHRYRSESLGFQVPYVEDWQITELSNCVVFAMQLNPDPYVRLAVGRIQAARNESLEKSVADQLAHSREVGLTKTRCRFAGQPAIRVEGTLASGHVLDYYVERGPYRYWISVLADQGQDWKAYRPSIELILNEFRFI